MVNHYPGALLHHAKEEDLGREFLSYKMSIKVVADLHEAVAHIMRYTSGHSETIIAEEREAIDYFLRHIDAAAVYATMPSRHLPMVASLVWVLRLALAPRSFTPVAQWG